jgi:hypothetical protein
MAILQLSRITHRKGLATDLPQLAAAELGWAIDDRKLYIGNGEIIDGAPVVGNTEILTEYSDVLGMSSTYIYKGEAAGYVVETGPGASDIIRSLQSKFDEVVSVKDFGAAGDGVTDDTDAINRALYQLFCVQTNTEVRRSLFFPAGTYRVSNIIKVPPHAKLYGEGLTSSIINYEPFEVAATTMVADGRYAITTLGTTDFTAFGAASNTVDLVFTATGPATGDGTVREVTDAVVETADSLQQTRSNIGNNGASAPTGIEMSSMGVYSGEENSLLRLDSVTNSGFEYVGLHGPNNDVYNTGYETASVLIATSVSATHDVTLRKLDSRGTTYGLRAAGDIRGVVLETSGLDLHYKGVYVTNDAVAATALTAGEEYKIVSVGTTDFTLYGAADNNIGTIFTMSGGPGVGTGTARPNPGASGIVLSRNIFDNIAKEGIHFTDTLFNASGYNVFYNVGNDIGGSPSAPNIHVESDSIQYVSAGDLFERGDEYEGTATPRVLLEGAGGVYIDGSHSIHLGSYERQVGLEAKLTDAATNETIFENTDSAPNSYKVDYRISDANTTRMGTITVSVNDLGVSYSDDYVEEGDDALAVTIEAVSSGTHDSTFRYTSTNGSDATISFSVVKLD